MFSEEEKKAMNNLNFIVVTDIYDNEVSINKTEMINEYNHSVGIVLNLITKLQKEVEHQKEKRENQKLELAILNEKQKEMNKLINDVKSYKGQFKRQEREIKELQKENEERDKRIDLMSEEIFYKLNTDKFEYGYSINEVKTKFEKLAKKDITKIWKDQYMTKEKFNI